MQRIVILQRAGDRMRGECVVNGVGVNAGILVAQIPARIVSGEGAVGVNTAAPGGARECGSAAEMVSASGNPSPAAMEAAEATAAAEMTATTEVTTAAMSAAAMAAPTPVAATASSGCIDGG
jgi:hypothetical protein